MLVFCLCVNCLHTSPLSLPPFLLSLSDAALEDLQTSGAPKPECREGILVHVPGVTMGDFCNPRSLRKDGCGERVLARPHWPSERTVRDCSCRILLSRTNKMCKSFS